MATTTQTRKLYNNEVTLHFNPASRNRYQLESGETPVGVTTVLSKVLAKEALMLWPLNMAINFLTGLVGSEITAELLEQAKKQHTIRSDKGKDVGTIVHEAIEEYLINKTKRVVADEQANKALLAFYGWFDEVKPEVIATEQIVYSKSGNYAGTFDALLKIDGEVVLADVKTTNISRDAPLGIYPEYFLQLGAYSLAYSEAGGTHPKDLMVINASKQGVLSTLRASDIGLSVRDCELAWASVIKLYRFLTPLKQTIKEKV